MVTGSSILKRYAALGLLLLTLAAGTGVPWRVNGAAAIARGHRRTLHRPDSPGALVLRTAATATI